MSTYPIIRPIKGDFPARDVNGNCMCEFCRHWFPLIETLEVKLSDDPEGLKLFKELTSRWMNDGEELCLANAQLNGSWPGWEDLNGYSPRTHKVMKRTEEEIRLWDEGNGNISPTS